MSFLFAGFLAITSLASFATAFSARAQTHSAAPVPVNSLAGNYAGTLQAGEAQLHLLLHLTKNGSGILHGTLDSLDQGVYGIEATKVAQSGSTLELNVASVGAHFEGKISADFRVIEGTWKQGNAELPLKFLRHASNAASYKAKDAVFPVEGVWQSALETHGMRLRLQLHVSHGVDKQLVAALDSLDQSVSGLPANNVSLKEAAFHFEVPAVAGVFEGTFDATKNTIKGNWSQTGAEAVLEFKRSDEPLAVRRPQNPIEPLPYHQESVSFSKKSTRVVKSLTPLNY